MEQQTNKNSGHEPQQEISELSRKLKSMKKTLPRLTETSQNFHCSTSRKSEYDVFPAKSIWTETATGWTRDTQPVYRIPLSQRFQEVKQTDEGLYPQLNLQLRSKITERGIKFSQDKRHELFTFEHTPSPNHYHCRRYLETLDRGSRPKSKQLSTLNPEKGSGKEHIRGGMIGRFENHPSLYDPQIGKVGYNEKMIVESRREKEKQRSFKIRVNQNRNRSIQ